MDLSFDIRYLRSSFMGRYQYPAGRVRPFLQAGFSLAYALRMEGNRRVERLNVTTYTVEDTPIFEAYRSLDVGWLGSAGVLVGPWTGELRYNRSFGISVFSGTETPLTIWSLLFGYRFGGR